MFLAERRFRTTNHTKHKEPWAIWVEETTETHNYRWAGDRRKYLQFVFFLFYFRMPRGIGIHLSVVGFFFLVEIWNSYEFISLSLNESRKPPTTSWHCISTRTYFNWLGDSVVFGGAETNPNFGRIININESRDPFGCLHWVDIFIISDLTVLSF